MKGTKQSFVAEMVEDHVLFSMTEHIRESREERKISWQRQGVVTTSYRPLYSLSRCKWDKPNKMAPLLEEIP
jgi:hypothetical protein